MYFDEARLDDPVVLATADLRLRGLAESGARVRREATCVREAWSTASERFGDRPRTVLVAGVGADLIDLAAGPSMPVPLVAWQGEGLPGWVGSLDLVLVLAPDGGDPGLARVVAEARRRGCRVVVAAPQGSIVADHVSGADAVLIAVATADSLAVTIGVLEFLGRLGLAPAPGIDEIADAADGVALECTPRREFSLNPAKLWSIALSDTVPLVWGGSGLAAHAAAQVAAVLRRATGLSALADHAPGLLPVLEAARVASIFDDPIEDRQAARPALLILEDGADLSGHPGLHADRRALVGAADARNIRVEVIGADLGTAMARYARLVLAGRYAAEYLHLGQVSA